MGLYDDSDSLLWVDGNTTDTTITIPTGTPCTYNVKDPTMWAPMSVLSGLASGYCERLAVAKATVVGANTTVAIDSYTAGGVTYDVNWVLKPSGDDPDAVQESLAANAAVVSNFAANIALCNTTSMFQQHGGETTTLVQPTSTTNPATGKASSYMAAFDSAMTTLLTTPVSRYQADSTGQNPYTFNTLATAASAAGGADISIMPVSGGAAFVKPMLNTYPSEWAKERKWMLDQLKYTGSRVIVEKVRLAGIDGQVLANPEVSSARFEAYQYMDASGTVVAAKTGAAYAFSAFISGGSTLSLANSASYNKSAAAATTINTISGATNNMNYLIGAFSYDVTSSGNLLTQALGPGSTGSRYQPGNFVPTAVSATKTGTIVKGRATVFLGATEISNSGPEYWLNDSATTGIWDEYSFTDVTEATTAVSEQTYAVKAGGTLTIPSNVTALAATVFDGGKVCIVTGGTCRNLNLMHGGLYEPVPATAGGVVSVNQFIEEYNPALMAFPTTDERDNPWSVATTGNTTYTPGDYFYVPQNVSVNLIGSGRLFVFVNGGSCVLSSGSGANTDVFATLLNGATMTLFKYPGEIASAFIGPGCVLDANFSGATPEGTCGLYTAEIAVCSGGTLTITSSPHLTGKIRAEKGAALNIDTAAIVVYSGYSTSSTSFNFDKLLGHNRNNGEDGLKISVMRCDPFDLVDADNTYAHVGWNDIAVDFTNDTTIELWKNAGMSGTGTAKANATSAIASRCYLSAGDLAGTCSNIYFWGDSSFGSRVIVSPVNTNSSWTIPANAISYDETTAFTGPIPTCELVGLIENNTVTTEAAVLAINGGTITAPPDTYKDHYKDFRVRQYKENPDTSNT